MSRSVGAAKDAGASARQDGSIKTPTRTPSETPSTVGEFRMLRETALNAEYLLGSWAVAESRTPATATATRSSLFAGQIERRRHVAS